MSQPEKKSYEIHACRYCGNQVSWDRWGRGVNDFGWYCSNHRSPEHPDTFHGYCSGDEAEVVETVPRAVADGMAGAIEKFTIVTGLGSPTGTPDRVEWDRLDAALAKYREAVG